ncbi:MAG: GH36-type glycosyl hydrolase domain-containing protein [Candidatus Hermodarchaeota archaeon]
MTYGYFSQDGREYVIVRPDTPTPWINYLSNSQYCAMVSNTGGGYSFHIDPRDRRILRYRYNNIPMDRPGRYIYIRDNQVSEYWSPTWQPVLKQLDTYECRHGLGYTKISSSYLGIKADITYFVPLDENLEIWQLTLKNNSSEKRILSIFSYAEFCLWRALGDQNDLQYIQNVAVAKYEEDAIYYSLFDQSSGYAFFSSSKEIISFDCDREEFIGLHRSESNPLSVERGRCSNSQALGGNPIAATCNTLELAPQEEKSIIFILGVVWEKKEAKRFIQKYKDNLSVKNEFQKIRDSWIKHLENFMVDTPDKEFDLIVNVWNPYQSKITFDWSRYVSFYETGIGRGMGFRDSNQDTMGISYALPHKVRQRLLDLAQNQFESGKVYHVYFPLTGKGGFPDYVNKNMQFFSDDHLWLILAVWDYIKETGDITILNEEVNFVEGSSASFYEHLKRSIDFTLSNLGKHRIPLIGTADWNDTLGLPGPNNSGESVWVAMQFHKALLDLAELARLYTQEKDSKEFIDSAEKIKKHINETAWDGEWYIRAYTDAGEVVGSSKCTEGQIFLNTQTWAIISEIAPNERAIQCLNSVKKYLDTEYGVMLFAPPYTRFYPELGGISTFPPGLKENASIFCHTNPWLIMAECILGRGNIAYDYYKKIAPTTKTNITEIHRAEPYIYSQMIAGKNHPKFGLAKNSWLTGTAAWSMKVSTQWILGIRPIFSGLLVDPCIPKEWSKFKVVRHFRNATYDIKVENPNNVSKGINEVRVGNKKLENNLLPVFKDGKRHIVEVTMD